MDLEMNTRKDLKRRVEKLEEEICELKSQLLRLSSPQPIIDLFKNPPYTAPNTWPVWTPNMPYIGDLPDWQRPVTISSTAKSFEAQAS